MKTNFLKITVILLCLGGFPTTQAQGLYNLAGVGQERNSDTVGIKINRHLTVSGEDFSEGVEWTNYTVGGGAGFGWSDNDGSSETALCVSAEFLAKVAGDDKNPNGAGYLGAFGTYHNVSGDNFNENTVKAGVKFSYFDRITALNEVQLIYGAKAFYETGKQDFSGFKEDVSGYGISAYTGVNFKISNKVSIGVEIPVLSYLSRTFDANGSEFKEDSFSAAINKDNPAMGTIRWHLEAYNRRLEEEGADDW